MQFLVYSKLRVSVPCANGQRAVRAGINGKLDKIVDTAGC